MKKSTCLLLVLLASVFTAFAQQTTVSGFVTDADRNPIIGATVFEVGSGSNGTTTDVYGQYRLTVQSPSSTIQISYMGYVSVEYAASSSNLQNVVLNEDSRVLDDVVVIGYGTVRKSDLTGSVSVLKAEEFNRGAVTSAQDMLLAKVPGLHIVPGDGGPNSGGTIRIRGAASLNASNDPLIVIDGVPISENAAPGMGNGLSSINPNDIESFTVLKDASATAIYGSRASNGVIIITTKKGRGSKPQVSYSSSYYVNDIFQKYDVMNANEYRQYFEDNFDPSSFEYREFNRLVTDYSTDWQEAVTRTGWGTDQNISVYGDYNNRLPYRASVGYTHELGTIKTSSFDRFTADISVSPKFFQDHLTVNINAKGVYNKNEYISSSIIGESAFYDPTKPKHFYDENGMIDYDIAHGWWNWFDDKGNTMSLPPDSPMSKLYDSWDGNEVKRFLGNVQLDYKFHFLPELRANLNLGLDFTKTHGDKGVRPGSYQALRDTDVPGLGKWENYTNLRRDQTLEFYLSYANEIGKHRFDVLGGYSWQHFYKKDFTPKYVNETNEEWGTAYRSPSEYFLISFFGRANYTYNNKYMFTVTLRNDATSRYSKDNRWGLFPSAAFAWNIHDEDFLKNSKVVSEMKLRVGGGSTGQQAAGGYYDYLARYVIRTSNETQYFLGDDYYHPMQPRAYNPNLKWETTDTYNIGVDFGFFGGRLRGNVDAYFRETKDLLNTVKTPIGSNFDVQLLTNIGNMENKGVEVALGVIPIQTKDWVWNISMNGTWQNTKITKLVAVDNDTYYISNDSDRTRHMVGYSPYTYTLFKQVYNPDGSPLQNVLVDFNGDGQITDEDRYITNKSASPDFYFGFSSTLSWKNWDFGFNTHGSIGNYLFNSYYASNSSVEPTWLTDGFLVNLSKQAYRSGFKLANTSQQKQSDMFLENASFWKIDDITIGHTWRELFNSKLGIRVAFSVQNVATFTRYSGLDPEVGGRTAGTMWLRPRTYTLRLNVNF